VFGFDSNPMVKKKCRECGEEYEAPEIGELGISHRSWCVPRRKREALESIKLEKLIQDYKDEHQKELIRQVLREEEFKKS